MWGGRGGCRHEWGTWQESHDERELTKAGKTRTTDRFYGDESRRFDGNHQKHTAGAFCRHCGAWLGLLGLEPTPELFVEHIVEVFREVKRVLRHDGVLFLNLGDSFYSDTSTRNYGILREDVTEGELYGCAVAIRRYMPELWATCWQQAGKRAVPELLSQEIQGGTPRASVGTLPEILQNAYRAVSCENQEQTATEAIGDDTGTGREMRLLRRDGTDVPVPRPHQGQWTQGLREGGRPPWGMEACDSRGTAERQVSDTLLELQFGIRFVRFLSSLRLDISDLHPSVKDYFRPITGLKPKDLVGAPWRVAFALQADGWYLRSDIIWAKPNPMPESVTDRPTKAHEYLFLLSKSERYFYDAEAIKEKTLWADDRRAGNGHIDYDGKRTGENGTGQRSFVSINPAGRNRRSVWTIATEAFPEAHFATFPTALVEPCILAGTSEAGRCDAKVTKLRVRRDLTPEQQEKVQAYLQRKGLI